MEIVSGILRLHTETLNTGQMVARAVVIFFSALAFIRVAGIRTLGNQTTFDNLTTIILGAILGRAIVSAQHPFFPSLIAVLSLMLLHRGASWLAYKNHLVGKVFKGEQAPLLENGVFNEKNLKRHLVTKDDIKESLHLFLNSEEFGDIKAAYLERSGEISIIKNPQKE